MMGRLKDEQEQLFYEFCLDEVVPDDHLVRGIAGVLDLSWVPRVSERMCKQVSVSLPYRGELT